MSATKTVWITGASSGIGAALAVEMANHGWQVAASGRDRPRLDDVCQRVPGSIHAFELDVTDAQACQRIAADIAARLGPIDLVVFNAGVSCPYSIRDFDAELFRRMMDINYNGAVNGIAAVLPAMRERGSGHIALTASVAGYRGLPGAAPYCATKAAMIALAEGFRSDLEPLGIAVSVITPGFVRSPMTDKNRFRMPFLMEPDPAATRIRKGLAAKRFEITFPRRLTYFLKLLQRLPYAAYFPIIQRVAKRTV